MDADSVFIPFMFSRRRKNAYNGKQATPYLLRCLAVRIRKVYLRPGMHTRLFKNAVISLLLKYLNRTEETVKT